MRQSRAGTPEPLDPQHRVGRAACRRGAPRAAPSSVARPGTPIRTCTCASARRGHARAASAASAVAIPKPIFMPAVLSRIRGDAPSQTTTAAAIPAALATRAAGPLDRSGRATRTAARPAGRPRRSVHDTGRSPRPVRTGARRATSARSADSVSPATRPSARKVTTAADGAERQAERADHAGEHQAAGRHGGARPEMVGQPAARIRARAPHHVQAGPDQRHQGHGHAGILQPEQQQRFRHAGKR